MMHAGYPGQYRDTRASVDCKYHLEGRCSLGDKCPFKHQPEKFNTAARPSAAFAPRSQLQPCHFYLQGRCTKGDKCPFQHPAQEQAATPRVAVPTEDEMNIEFDEDESPRQPSASKQQPANASPKQLPVQARLGGKVPQSTPQQAQHAQQAAQQPLSSRLGAQPIAPRRPEGQSAVQPSTTSRHLSNSNTEQDVSAQPKGSVFQRLSMSRPGTAPDRQSAPANRPSTALAARPKDARDLLVQTVAAKARVGRKEAELVKPLAASGGPELQPTSIAQRRVVAVNKGVKGGTPTHAPKFASPAPPEANGTRKSALERLGRPTPSSTPTSTPAAARRAKRPSLQPFTATRLKPSAPAEAATPSQTPTAAAATPSATPAAGSTNSVMPGSEQSTGGTDKRGRQRITWQPPTASQSNEAAQESRVNISKRKASDAASPALESASAAAADAGTSEVSPSKRMKAQPDPAQSQAANEPAALSQAPQQQQHQAVPSIAEQNAAPNETNQRQPDADTNLQQADNSTALAEATGLQDSGQADAFGGDEDEVLYDDNFDDEATMRELDALG